MKKELVLATGNDHKKRELSNMVPQVRIMTPADLRIPFDYEEIGNTYLANAFGKAMALYQQLDSMGKAAPVLADDSGLSVVALDGAPGVHSARYGSVDAGNRLTAAERNRLLLDKMEGMTDRRAFFVCCMVLLFSENRYVIAQETWDGEIAAEPSSGAGGFGYDPVFYLPDMGVTAADLSERQKNELSHRGRALSRILPHISEI